MSTTEVYSCKAGQKLKEGRLDYAPHVETREQAEADAKRRCQADPGLAKVAYYLVSEDGRFRMLHSYTNPNPGTAKPVRRAGVSRDIQIPSQDGPTAAKAPQSAAAHRQDVQAEWEMIAFQ